MKKYIIALVVGSCLPFSLLAETPNEREFMQLREQRDKAMAAAALPINQRYKASIEELLRRATQTVQLDLARQIRAELLSMSGAPAVTAASK